MNKEIVRFRDKDPDGQSGFNVIVDVRFRFPLTKKQVALIKEIESGFEYDPAYESLDQYAKAVMNKCMKHPVFKDDGQRWHFADNEILLEIEK